MRNTLISVIIPTHNSQYTIENCLRSLKSQSYPREKYEIIVIDDGSTDRTVEISKNNGADKVIQIHSCFQGEARNIGVKNSSGEILAFIDSDCEAVDGWLSIIEKELANNQAIGGPVLNGNPHSLVAWADYLMEFSVFSEYKKRSVVVYVPGCNQICRKNDFIQTGGYPEYRISEDVVLSQSLKKNGVKIIFVPELKIRHLCRTKLEKFLANQKVLGAFSVKIGKKYESNYSKLISSRWKVPLIFISKIAAKSRHAIKAKKFFKFLITLPFIILGSFSWCKGVWKEMGTPEQIGIKEEKT